MGRRGCGAESFTFGIVELNFARSVVVESRSGKVLVTLNIPRRRNLVLKWLQLGREPFRTFREKFPDESAGAPRIQPPQSRRAGLSAGPLGPVALYRQSEVQKFKRNHFTHIFLYTISATVDRAAIEHIAQRPVTLGLGALPSPSGMWRLRYSCNPT